MFPFFCITLSQCGQSFLGVQEKYGKINSNIGIYSYEGLYRTTLICSMLEKSVVVFISVKMVLKKQQI